MKIRTLSVVLAAALTIPLATSCSEDTSNAASKTMDSASKDMKEMGSKVADQFAELKKSTQKQLDAAGATADDLQKKADAKSGEAKAQMEKLGADIKSKKDEIVKSISEMDVKDATADAYASAKKKLDEAMSELSKLVEKAKNM